jgi:rhodanese-related sulfurtransferase
MTTLADMLSSANAAVPEISAEESSELISGRDALLLDVRDASEISHLGKLDGALNVPRGMLEFRADPASNLYNPELRPERPIVIYCASGGRSALAGKSLSEMGYAELYNLGSFKEAANAGFPTSNP